MQVAVQLRPDVAESFHDVAAPNAAAAALRAAVAARGLRLEPMHPQVDDPSLGRFFFITAPDPLAAHTIADVLRALDGVEAAYVKPPDEAP